MQGRDAAESIRQQLLKIESNKFNYDVIVIVRGGGSSTDLSIFNDERLARTLCNISLPVITGIGHQKNSSVLDEIALISRMNPTDAAHFIAEHYRVRIEEFDDIINKFTANAKQVISESRNKLNVQTGNLKSFTLQTIREYRDGWKKAILTIKGIKGKIDSSQFMLKNYAKSIFLNSKRKVRDENGSIFFLYGNLSKNTSGLIEKNKDSLNTFKKVIKIADPVNTLKLGYAITSQNGKIIKDVNQINHEEPLLVKYSTGEVRTKIQKENNNE